MRKVHLNNVMSLPSTEVGIRPRVNTTLYTAAPALTDTQQVAIAQNPWIMIIDDSATVRKIVEICLCRVGYEVRSFPDGIAAIEWLTKPTARIPTLIILDIGLPKIDGYEVARRLKTKPQLSQTVIIMLTRHDGMIDKLKGRLAGAEDYIVKPFQTQTLLTIIKTHMGQPL